MISTRFVLVSLTFIASVAKTFGNLEELKLAGHLFLKDFSFHSVVSLLSFNCLYFLFFYFLNFLIFGCCCFCTRLTQKLLNLWLIPRNIQIYLRTGKLLLMLSLILPLKGTWNLAIGPLPIILLFFLFMLSWLKSICIYYFDINEGIKSVFTVSHAIAILCYLHYKDTYINCKLLASCLALYPSRGLVSFCIVIRQTDWNCRVWRRLCEGNVVS